MHQRQQQRVFSKMKQRKKFLDLCTNMTTKDQRFPQMSFITKQTINWGWKKVSSQLELTPFFARKLTPAIETVLQ